MRQRPSNAAIVVVAGLGHALLPATSSAQPALPSGRDILERQEAARKLPAFQAKATLSTSKQGTKDGTPKLFRWWRKLGSDGVHFVTLTRFDAPATIRGEGLLLREGATDNDVLLYLPRFKKVRRVEGQSQTSSFMGSVFSYSDIAVPHAEDYHAEVLREARCPGDAGQRCWGVDITPAQAKVKQRTGYSHSVQWIRIDNAITVYGELYDTKGALWKRLTAAQVKEIDPRAHKWLPHHVTLEDVPGKRVTVLTLGEVKVDVALGDELFTEQSLAAE